MLTLSQTNHLCVAISGASHESLDLIAEFIEQKPYGQSEELDKDLSDKRKALQRRSRRSTSLTAYQK